MVKIRKNRRRPHIAPDLTTRAGRRRAERELIWGDHGFLRLRFSNLHQISPEMWRSNQPSPKQIHQHVRARGIRTIINLRGESTKGYYLLEKEACAAAGVTLIDYQVFSRDTPTMAVIEGAKALFEEVRYPALMHCKSGADRAGLMSVLYKIFRQGEPVDVALAQLSLKFLHVRQGKTGLLDAFFEAYLMAQAQTGKPFLDWLQEDYDREAVKAAFLAGRGRALEVDSMLKRE